MQQNHERENVACVQTSPISFVARGKGTFPRATKEIGDVCTQARENVEKIHRTEFERLDKYSPSLLTDYNNTKHRAIGITPIEASARKNHSLAYFKLNPVTEFTDSQIHPKLKIGDKLRISKYKRPVFDKGYTPNWTEKIFAINEIQPTDPITYKLKDLAGEAISGSIY